MRINIKPLDGTQGAVIEISKKALISDLKIKISKSLEIDISQQRLFYFGKELQDNVALLDYRIIESGTVQIIVATNIATIKKEIVDIKTELEEEIVDIKTEPEEEIEYALIDVESKYYRIGDLVDVLLNDTGAWYEGIVRQISMKETDELNDSEENVVFKIQSAPHLIPTFELNLNFKDIRPRAYYIYKFAELTPGLTVLANYNLENKQSRGLWYNFKITDITRTNISGTILVGRDETTIENCSIIYKSELFRLEVAELATKRKKDKTKYTPRIYPYICSTCRDDPNKQCKDCGCKICLGKQEFEKILLCDECDNEYHIYCLNPPLDDIPADDWYCPECKIDDNEIVKKGEVKLTKKQINMPNKKSTSTRDWGQGMACAGRSKICTIVNKNHYGPIPNVDVGTRWRYRIQLSEAGVHRPSVSGIHGVASDGAYSLVLSAGYDDDIDLGTEFVYTGSGGRDLSSNKRVSSQSFNQELTNCNKALAMNCNTPFNTKGGFAKDWRGGKPVRVIRTCKARKHSKYAPKEGIRYDGIYKVVRYYREIGKSGFYVWKYLLRRDDDAPAPWEENGVELDIIYPPFYEESKHKTSSSEPASNKKRKRQTKDSTVDDLNPAKKSALVYELPPDIKQLIEKDKINSNNWIECSNELQNGKLKYREKIEEIFKCICCQELVYEPVTLECKHNFCKNCLKRSFDCKMFKCPCCRHVLDEKLVLEINQNCSKALKLLFPGYGPGSRQ